MPHSSNLNSTPPSDETASTKISASGCVLRIACTTAGRSQKAPVDVSLCTKPTASTGPDFFSASATLLGSIPSFHSNPMRTVSRPQSTPVSCQRSLKKPLVTQAHLRATPQRTVPSHAALPDAVTTTTCCFVPNSRFRRGSIASTISVIVAVR